MNRFIREPLAHRVAKEIEREIREGRFRETMPAEIPLSRTLGISRKTLRQALEILRGKGLIESHQGRPTRIVDASAPRAKPKATRSTGVVTILSQDPIATLRQHTLHWIDELRSRLHEAGRSLNIVAGKVAFREKSGDGLARLVLQHPSDAWVLIRASERIQRWFDASGMPTIVAGATFPGVRLPSVTVDNRAISYHAVGHLTGRDHRNIVLFAPKDMIEGYRIMVDVFEESIRRHRDRGVNGSVVYLEQNDTARIGRQILATFRRNPCPTAGLFIRAKDCITSYSVLPGAGFAIPRDVSLISAFADQALAHLLPAPGHYWYDPAALAERQFRILVKLLGGLEMKQETVEIIPELRPGHSVAHRGGVAGTVT